MAFEMPFEISTGIRHPYTDYSLAEAVALATGHAKAFGENEPQTLEEARTYILDMSANAGHVWITGAAALDVLDVAIDGKDLTDDCRICPRGARCTYQDSTRSAS